MKSYRVWELPLLILATPLMAFWVTYLYRWILTGQCVQGGGDRALVAFLLSVVLAGILLLIENINEGVNP